MLDFIFAHNPSEVWQFQSILIILTGLLNISKAYIKTQMDN